MFPVLVGMAGLATEYGDALLIKAKLQRIADTAAWSGAMAYNRAGTTGALNAAVSRIATLNGIASNEAVGSIVTSPSSNTNKAVLVTASRTLQLGLSKVLTGRTSLAVRADAYVELRSDSTGIPCLIALNGTGGGVTMSGAGIITANTCAVSSNNSVTAPNGTSITTPVLTYNASTALTSTTLANVHSPTVGGTVNVSKRSVSDPLSSKTAVTTAAAHLTDVALIGNPTMTTPPSGTAITFDYTATGKTFPSGCSGSFNSSSKTWTVTCTGTGPYNFGAISLGGGITVNFNTGGSAATTYNFSGLVNVSGTAMTFGPGIYNLGGGLQTGGGSTTTFAAGTFNIGLNSTSCSGGTYSICHNGATLTFAGPSTFVITNGIYNTGGATLKLGVGSSGNSYQLGKSSTGYGINMGGGSTVSLNDASSGLFKVNGNVSNGGGSCLTLPAAATHDINGSLILGGGATLGSGVYTIYNYVALGASGGGAVTCSGTSIGMLATGVTLVVGGNATVSCSNGTAGFCITAGYSNVTLTAPTTGSTAYLAVIGPTSSTNTAAAILSAGASGANITGAFYFPYGAFTMNGGASLGSSGCLEVIASQISVLAGTALGTICPGLAGTSLLAGSIALVK